MLFIVILVLTTILLAASAAFFSIYGLATIFSGSFWPVVLMGTSLELGKLVAASYVYRYWHIIGRVMKTYLITAVVVLMFLTSVGIFGYLSLAHMKDSVSLKQIDSQIVLLENEKRELTARKLAIDTQISQLPTNMVKGRTRLIGEFSPEVKRINDRIPEITASIQTLTQQKLETQVHVGPITYIASAFGYSVDDATKWMILLIVFAFDPLAVVLTVGANIAIQDRIKNQFVKRVQDVKPIAIPQPQIIEREKIIEVPIAVTRYVPILYDENDRVNSDAEFWMLEEIEQQQTRDLINHLDQMTAKKIEDSPHDKAADNAQLIDKINLLREALQDMKSRTSLSIEDQNQVRVIERLLRKRNVL
jgi:hypothetical protein